MSFDLKGKLLVKYDTQNVSRNPEKVFNKREFVVETTETINDGREFKQTIPFQLVGDKVTMLDAFNIGDQVQVSFNLKGRGWRKDESAPVRYFGSNEAWSIVGISAQTAVGAPSLPSMPEEDDLPF